MHVWEARFYDFNVWTEHKRVEKLRYMHRNPVKRGLVSEPEQWAPSGIHHKCGVMECTYKWRFDGESW